jgi:hypothetical protein
MSLSLKEGDIYHIPISGTDEVNEMLKVQAIQYVLLLPPSLASGTDFYTASRLTTMPQGSWS